MPDTTVPSHAEGPEAETGHGHPYHLVDPSPWPILGAFAGGLLAVGAVIHMHDGGPWLLILGVLAILGVMAGWWRDVIYESVVERAHSAVTKLGMRYGMLLFIASEVMFFVAFFWAYFDAWLFAAEAKQVLRLEYTGGAWPPEGMYAIAPFGLPLLMTMILLLSGCTVTWAHHALQHGQIREAGNALALTVVLGVVFSGFQIYEYAHSPFGFREGVYPSVFYMATGFHGFHVVVGTIFLAVCWWRVTQGHFTKESHFGFEAAAWYWHFVDVVWLFLFAFIYWFSTIGAQMYGH